MSDLTSHVRLFLLSNGLMYNNNPYVVTTNSLICEKKDVNIKTEIR